MFDVGCEFCGDVPRDLIYLPNYTKRIEEQNISMGRPNKYIRSEDVFFVCSCGIVASSVDRIIYNEQVIMNREYAESLYIDNSLLEFEQMEYWSSKLHNVDNSVFFLERNQTSSVCPF